MHILVNDVKDLPPQVLEVLKSRLDFIPADTNLEAYNDKYSKLHSNDPRHLQSSYNVRILLDSNAKSQSESDLLKLLEHPSIAIRDALAGLTYLDEWKSDEKTKDQYREAATKKWPEASVFQKN